MEKGSRSGLSRINQLKKSLLAEAIPRFDPKATCYEKIAPHFTQVFLSYPWETKNQHF